MITHALFEVIRQYGVSTHWCSNDPSLAFPKRASGTWGSQPHLGKGGAATLGDDESATEESEGGGHVGQPSWLPKQAETNPRHLEESWRVAKSWKPPS